MVISSDGLERVARSFQQSPTKLSAFRKYLEKSNQPTYL